MAPMVSNSKNKDEKDEIIKRDLTDEKSKLFQLRKHIEKNFDYVGKDFSRKVREVYYDKKNNQAIYGTATPKEREELAEEGIDFLTVPWVSKDN